MYRKNNTNSVPGIVFGSILWVKPVSAFAQISYAQSPEGVSRVVSGSISGDFVLTASCASSYLFNYIAKGETTPYTFSPDDLPDTLSYVNLIQVTSSCNIVVVTDRLGAIGSDSNLNPMVPDLSVEPEKNVLFVGVIDPYINAGRIDLGRPDCLGPACFICESVNGSCFSCA